MMSGAPAKVRLSEQDLERLAEKLRHAVQGEVRFDHGSRALYATDGSLYRHLPLGVVVPRTEDDVRNTLSVCRAAGVPILSRGGGTSLAGQTCNTAVILDFSKYLNRVLHIDPEHRLARVQPGCVLDWLRDAAEEHQLTFGPDPSTHNHNCLGGMLGNNSCGVHSIMAGRTADNVRSMRVITYDGLEMTVGPTSAEELERIITEGGRRGEIYAGLRRLRDEYAAQVRDKMPSIPRRVSGFNLDELLLGKGFNVARALVGSEGTCVTILEAELELVPSPPARVLLVLGYADVVTSADHVPEILAAGPIGLEGMDYKLLQEMAQKDMHPEARDMLPEGGSWLFVEFGGDDKAEARRKAFALIQQIAAEPVTDDPAQVTVQIAAKADSPAMVLLMDDQDRKNILKTREAGLGATARSPQLGDTLPGWEDAAVPPERLGGYLRAFRQLLHKHGYDAALYGHFGDGCIHCRINFNLSSSAGIANWKAFMEEAADLVVRYGGSLSGEHGDGQVRAQLLPRMYGEHLLDAMRQFKSLWDPQGMMNPGKVIDPYPMTENLRDTPRPMDASVFAFANDGHSFAHAVNRCVGIGECRRASGGVMCPSYRATMDEQHSTRGRARLLFEMLRGDPLKKGWRDEAVHEALDLCLACKGCKRDCPVLVDMATLKAEFMARYYKGRLRPRAAYSMGLIWWWSRIASLAPGLVNLLLRSTLVKKLGGIAPQRQMPRYAEQTFRAWFLKRQPVNVGLPQVMLWPDTFNNYFSPRLLQAAVRVLEAAGYCVTIPSRVLCCGRPLYAEGMLSQARRQLGDILDNLSSAAQQRIPVVGLEPSCVASFRDELPELFNADERAHYLAGNTYLLTEFLRREGYHPPRLARRALVHLHCHQHASLYADADREMLERMGVEHRVLDAGCCGMAGSFGFDAKKFDLSLRIGEQQLLPQVRASAADTLIITNGFSCKEQITHTTGRRTWNMAEILALALDEGEPTLALLDTRAPGSDENVIRVGR